MDYTAQSLIYRCGSLSFLSSCSPSWLHMGRTSCCSCWEVAALLKSLYSTNTVTRSVTWRYQMSLNLNPTALLEGEDPTL